jgi:uncharacterized protein (DUF58 family)
MSRTARGLPPAAERTPDRPGPGPTPEALLRALDIQVRRRVEGLLAGEYRSASVGIGTELAQVRPYQPGDDVRRMDWNATARTSEPHTRVEVAERALSSWLVLDTSPSMAFGTADRRKADVAEGVALAVGHVATRRGNRLGVVTFGDANPQSFPPRQGRAGLLGLLTTLRREPQMEGGGATSLGDALGRTGRFARTRSLIFVVSDFRGPRDWKASLLALAGRHDVVAVEVRDRREQELPSVGEVWLVDPETGRYLRVDTSSRTLRERFAAAAAAEREELAGVLRSAGCDHVVLWTAGDWLASFGGFLRRRGNRWKSGAVVARR